MTARNSSLSINVDPITTSIEGGAASQPEPDLLEALPPISLSILSSSSNPTSLSSLHRSLSTLSSYSSDLDSRLLELLDSSQDHILQARQDISKLAPQLDLIKDEAEVLKERLSDNAETARRISRRVGGIDEQKRRLDISRRWCREAADFKSSLQSLEQSLDSQDYETAVRHCISAMSISSEVVNSQFASIVVPTSSLPDPPPLALLSLRKRLLDIFTRGFNLSTGSDQERNQEMASWYFKQFPRIGWRMEGLQVYSEFAKGMVRDRNKTILDSLGFGLSSGNSSSISQSISSNPHHFSRLLTMLFENLALLIDMHQPVVDRHYGVGNFAKGVMGGLMEECDRTGGKILRSWQEGRDVQKKLVDIDGYRFNHSALSSNRSNVNANSSQNSNNRKGAFNIPGRPNTPSNQQAANPNALPEIEGPDGREVDRLLGELAGMHSRWGLFGRFVNGRVNPPASNQSNPSAGPEEGESQVKDFRRNSLEPSSRQSISLDNAEVKEDVVLFDPLERSQLGQELEEKLHSIYVPLESWYLRSSIEKAHRLDQPDHSSFPYSSSLLEDVFYVFRSVLSRVLLTSSIPMVSSMIRVIRTTIDEEYVGVLVRRLDGVGRSAQAVMGVDGPRKENASREMKSVFVTYLNVLHTSSQYMSRVLEELSSERNLSQFYSQSQLPDVQAMVQGLDVLVGRMKSAVSTSLELLFATLTRPRLRAVLSEAYRDKESAYELNEDGFAEAEYHDIVRRRFVKGWEVVMSGWKDIFNEQNYDLYFAMALEALVRPWENVVMGMRFTELGALRFDKDVRGLSSYLSSQTTSGIRDKFTRLQQISYVLNLDEIDEAEDVYESAASSGVTWRLSANEVKQVRRLRL